MGHIFDGIHVLSQQIGPSRMQHFGSRHWHSLDSRIRRHSFLALQVLPHPTAPWPGGPGLWQVEKARFKFVSGNSFRCATVVPTETGYCARSQQSDDRRRDFGQLPELSFRGVTGLRAHTICKVVGF